MSLKPHTTNPTGDEPFLPAVVSAGLFGSTHCQAGTDSSRSTIDEFSTRRTCYCCSGTSNSPFNTRCPSLQQYQDCTYTSLTHSKQKIEGRRPSHWQQSWARREKDFIWIFDREIWDCLESKITLASWIKVT